MCWCDLCVWSTWVNYVRGRGYSSEIVNHGQRRSLWWTLNTNDIAYLEKLSPHECLSQQIDLKIICKSPWALCVCVCPQDTMSKWFEIVCWDGEAKFSLTVHVHSPLEQKTRTSDLYYTSLEHTKAVNALFSSFCFLLFKMTKTTKPRRICQTNSLECFPFTLLWTWHERIDWNTFVVYPTCSCKRVRSTYANNSNIY